MHVNLAWAAQVVRGRAAGFPTGDRVMTGTVVAVVWLEAAPLEPPAQRSPVTRTQAAGGEEDKKPAEPRGAAETAAALLQP